MRMSGHATPAKILRMFEVIPNINATSLPACLTGSQECSFPSSFSVRRLDWAILVTEDEKLRKAATKFVKTIAYTDLESRLAQS